MKGQKGLCTAGTYPNIVRATKYNNEQNCQIALDSLREIGVARPDFTIYKCSVCQMYHFGKPEGKLLYSMN